MPACTEIQRLFFPSCPFSISLSLSLSFSFFLSPFTLPWEYHEEGSFTIEGEKDGGVCTQTSNHAHGQNERRRARRNRLCTSVGHFSPWKVGVAGHKRTQRKKAWRSGTNKGEGGNERMEKRVKTCVRVYCSLSCSVKFSTLRVPFGHTLALWQEKALDKKRCLVLFFYCYCSRQRKEPMTTECGCSWSLLRTSGKGEERETVCLWSTMTLSPLYETLLPCSNSLVCEVVYLHLSSNQPTNRRIGIPSLLFSSSLRELHNASSIQLCNESPL